MQPVDYQHTPVMVKEVVEMLDARLLDTRSDKTIVDCTVGGGGHAETLLRKCQMSNVKCQLIGIDQDGDIPHLKNIEYIHGNFGDLDKYIKYPVDGFLFDLGVSSYQIDTAERGFSFRFDAPLDMRMDKSQKLTAEEIINHWDEKDLVELFSKYGEERFSKRIARKILESRQRNTVSGTQELKEIIEKAIPTWKKRESVARVFQALRIAVNSELTNLEKALPTAISLLKSKGRIVVIAYHSLEDRIVKNIFREAAKTGQVKILTKKPMIASEEEVAQNSRAKSAKLRAVEKL